MPVNARKKALFIREIYVQYERPHEKPRKSILDLAIHKKKRYTIFMAKKITPSQENYLKAILQVADEHSKVRSIDVARLMGVSRASVNKALISLSNEGLVKHEYYGDITLTKEGETLARVVLNRFEILYKFLTEVLEVPEEVASTDACEMEHALSNETTCRLCAYIKHNCTKLETCPSFVSLEECPNLRVQKK